MLDERSHAFVDPLVFDRVIVVQHKDEPLRDAGEFVDQRRESLRSEVDARRTQHRQRRFPIPGATERMASMTYIQNLAGSLSTASNQSQATGRSSLTDAPHCATSIVFPLPAGP